MWFFSRKNRVGDSGIFDGFVDWHSHLLPGVDDGVSEYDESCAIIERMVSVGVRHIVFTPHIMEDIPNETEALTERFAQFQIKNNSAVKLSVAAENMLDNLFVKRLEAGDVLCLKDNLLLVETSYFNPPLDLFGMLDAIKSAGMFPILAHPERYRYMSDTDYEKLRSSGVMMQLNIPSLIGGYGHEACRKSCELLRRGYYDFVGLDIHRKTQYERFLEAEIPNKLLAKLRPVVEASNRSMML